MLRGYQADIYNRCVGAWNNGHQNVSPVCATGSGKTKIFSHAASQHDGPGVAMAHRSVLIGQISIAMAREGIVHDIVGQKSVVNTIVNAHMEEFGRNFYNPSSQFKVASVDTMPGRAAELSSWIKRVTWGAMDESHHVLFDNKWGREIQRFENPLMKWMLPTATPERADGKGLGRHASGLIDMIVEGPTPRWLIDNGYLTDYIIRAPLPSDLDLSDVEVGANGEYNQKQLRRAVHRSAKIIGNVVDTYLEHTPGKLGIVFAVDIEHARALTDEFNRKGVRCELITAEHSEEQRRAILRRYRQKETLVLVNVDLFGEGFDLPLIEVCMFARPTASYSLYVQQFGRALRLLIPTWHMERWESYTPAERLYIIATSQKPVAHIHDHVGNVLHFYGPPDIPHEWSLDDRSGRRSGKGDAIPLRVCTNPSCIQPFERFYPACPYCGTEVPVPPAPSLPEQVDGDITLYTPEMLRKFFGVETVAQALAKPVNTFCSIPPNVGPAVIGALRNHNRERIEQQSRLAQLMPVVMPPNRNDRENMRKFFLRFGVDVVQAKQLSAKETEELNSKIIETVRKAAS